MKSIDKKLLKLEKKIYMIIHVCFRAAKIPNRLLMTLKWLYDDWNEKDIKSDLAIVAIYIRNFYGYIMQQYEVVDSTEKLEAVLDNRGKDDVIVILFQNVIDITDFDLKIVNSGTVKFTVYE